MRIFEVLSLGAFLGSSFLATCLGLMSQDEPKYLLRLKSHDQKEFLDRDGFLKKNDFDYKKDPQSDHDFFIFANDEQYKTLSASFADKIDLIETARPLKDKLPNGYSDLDEIWSRMFDYEARYPSIVKVINMTAYGPGYTYEGRELPMIKISDNVRVDEDEPNIMIVSAHHAREIVTPHVALDTLERLAKGYEAGDREIVSIVDGNEIFISPLWNPDGYNYMWNINNLWRKNRKPFGNNYGVDQNRNYDAGWDSSSSCSGSTLPASDTYKGPYPNSEEETQIMVEFSLKRNFVKMNDYHSYGREVLNGFVCQPLAEKLDDWILEEAIALGKKATTTYGVRRPSSDGEHPQWNIRYLSSYSFITEISLEFQPPFSSAQNEANIVWPLTKSFLQKPIPYAGHVYSLNGSPLEAQIFIDEFPEVQLKTGSTFGNYYIIAPNGNYTVSFRAPGYSTSVKGIFIDNSRPLFNQDVYLTPSN